MSLFLSRLIRAAVKELVLNAASTAGFYLVKEAVKVWRDQRKEESKPPAKTKKGKKKKKL